MKLVRVILTLVLLTAVIVNGGDPKKFGKDITVKTTTKISEIYANPSKYLGKKVVIEGHIVDVCAKRGCWMEVKSDKPGQSMRVKVNDGEIVFPLDKKGSWAKVEGEVQEVKLTKEEAIEFYQHKAEEQKKTFDPKSVTGPVTLYQLKGFGAEIY